MTAVLRKTEVVDCNQGGSQSLSKSHPRQRQVQHASERVDAAAALWGPVLATTADVNATLVDSVNRGV